MEPILLEQPSQAMSWCRRILRLYWAESSLPEQVGLILALLGIMKDSRIAFSFWINFDLR